MAKFLNKKEQVIDFKLTPYGKKRLAAGKFKPAYYAFFDDGILYDSQYAGFTEKQNDINERIKNETQFLEGILSFTDIENYAPAGNYLEVATADMEVDDADIDISPVNKPIRTDKFSYGPSLSDVVYDSEGTQFSPATKLVTCQGQIVKIKSIDDTNYDFNVEDSVENIGLSSTSRKYDIPQIDVDLYYTRVIDSQESLLDSKNIQETIAQSPPFSDGNVIKLIKNDLVVYSEEVNTELLNENYEIEIFEIVTGSELVKLDRKYFNKSEPQIQDGYMRSATPHRNVLADLNTDSVEYYFDVLTDAQVDARIACGCSKSFNKNSYYVDLDFDCEKIMEKEEVYFDIYGSVTVPEICQPDNQPGGPGPNYTPDGEQLNEDTCGDE
tara:strand:+ start:7118 stop:8266 length:1149 start_codon:yes stop_codon:yes gene_type:complete